MSVVHDFKESLEISHGYESAPWWPIVYRKAFPSFLSMASVRDDGWAQRGGIDRIVVLKSGKTLSIDEKVRKEKWPDILLERWSDRKGRTPGWIQKSLACDYIAYAFIPTQECYLLPFQQLRSAWRKYGRDWIVKAEVEEDGFRIVPALNKGYITESVAVPIKTVMSALSDVMLTSWNDVK